MAWILCYCRLAAAAPAPIRLLAWELPVAVKQRGGVEQVEVSVRLVGDGGGQRGDAHGDTFLLPRPQTAPDALSESPGVL